MKNLLLALIAAIGTGQLFGQQQISGIVQSFSDNHPLVGASVKLPGEIETTTDSQGRFILTTEKGDFSLVVSYIGHTTDTVHIIWPATLPIVINLKPTETFLQEVLVSTGYERIPKERSTGSFSHIDNTTFNQQISTDVLSRLEATTGGYMVERRGGRPAQPLIRGLGTLSGPTEPLVILDNFPYDGDINNINPNEVEDITVLKDAAAASIWGARAANGVIVIRTKQGQYNQSLHIGMQANTTISNKPDLGYIRQMSASDFIDIEQMLYENGYYTSRINQNTRPALSPVIELMIRRENADASALATIDGQINALRNLDVRNDFSRHVYQPAVNQQYALNFEGGSEKLAWMVMAGYDHNKDNLDAGYQRLNLRFQNRYKPLHWIELTTGLRYMLSSNQRGRDGLGNVSVFSGNIYPYAQLADANGNPLPLTKQYRQTFIDETNAAGRLLDWSYFPLEDYKYINGTNTINDVLATTHLNVKVTDWLNAEVEYQYERQDNNGRVKSGMGSFFTRDIINYYSQVNTSDEVVRPIPRGDILDISNSQLNSHQVRGKMNFNYAWHKHDISAIGGAEIRHAGNARYGFRTYGYNDDILTYGSVDYLNTYPNYVSGAYSFIPRIDSFGRTTTRFLSMFANGAYLFDKRYTFSISSRRDASNLFGLATNDQWNLFWSVGGAWNVANEYFYNISWLPNLRLRATHGKSGNIDPSMVASTTMTYLNLDPMTLTPTARFDNYYNPELRWETSAMTNIGIDFGLFNGRVNGAIEYYHKQGTDLFGNAVVDYTGGVGRTVTKNASSMTGNGFDFEVNGVIVDKALKWQSNLRLSHYKDKVTGNLRASTSTSAIVTSVGGTTGLLAIEGKPVNSMFSYRWAGLDGETGEPMGYVDNSPSKNYNALMGNNLTIDDLVYHGSAIPTLFGSFSNTFLYKQFSLNVGLVYKFGYYFRRPSIRYSILFSNWQNAHSDFANRWQRPGDELKTDVPSLVYPASSQSDNFYAGSEVLVERGDHIRLQYIQASYRLSLANKRSIREAVLFLNANNVGVIWRANKQDLDPDFIGVNALVTPTSFSLGFRFSIQ